ncbi:MAG: proline dehydrogenase family protein [bacterium]|nr:proline dehydrogenase family protein [bacterium]
MLNSLVVKMLPLLPKSLVYAVAKRYIAGPRLEDAIRESKQQNSKGRQVTIDVLGEHIQDLTEADAAAEEYLRVLEAIQFEQLQGNVSVKPTQMGLGIDFQHAFHIYQKLLTSAREKNTFVRIDMEDSPYTDSTLELYRQLRASGFTNVGVVLQAYLRRTLNDIENLSSLMSHTLADAGKHIRLCKGIYVEPESIAYKGREEIRTNFKRCLDSLLDHDISVGIATHDEVLIRYSIQQIEKRSIPKEKYEFQMLLGVLPELGDRIVQQGHPLRMYVPFGEKWYAYSIRRLKENPAIAGYILRAMFGLR